MDCLARVSRRMYAGISPQELEAVRGLYLRMLEALSPQPSGDGAPSK